MNLLAFEIYIFWIILYIENIMTTNAPTNVQILANKTANSFKLYLIKLEKSGFAGTEPFLTDKIQHHVKNIAEQSIDFSVLLAAINSHSRVFAENRSGMTALKDIFVSYSYLTRWHSWLEEDYNIFKKYRFLSTQQGSHTSSGHMLSYSYLTEMNKDFDEITEYMQEFEGALNSSALLKYFLDAGSIKSMDDLMEMRNIYEQYLRANEGQLVIKLYIAYLQNTLDNKFSPKELVRQIIRDVENLKTSMLASSPVHAVPQNKEANIIQRLIQKYNLSPDAPSRSIITIMSELRSESNITDIRDACLKTAALLSAKSEKKFGFIIIRKVWLASTQAIEHNLWLLTDKKYLTGLDLIQSAAAGVNVKSIQRGQTIKTLHDIVKPSSLTDSLIFVNNEFASDMAQNYYYVLETIDGINYHFLLPWFSQTIRYIPATWLEYLEKLDYTPSRRLQSYNQLLNSVIVSKLTKPYIEIKYASRMEAKKEELYWLNLRTKIKDEIIAYINKQLSAVDQLSAKTIDNIMTNATFYQYIINVITQQISLDLTNPGAVDELRQRQWHIEIILSYFKDIDHIQRSFRHDLIEAYHKDYIVKFEQALGAITSSNSSNAMIRHKLLDVFGELLLGTLERYINRRSNIYLLLDRKSELLNKTLLKKELNIS
jgi:hypothetical protein